MNIEDILKGNEQAEFISSVTDFVRETTKILIEQSGKIQEKMTESFLKRMESLKPIEQIEVDKVRVRLENFIKYIEQVRLWNESVMNQAIEIENHSRQAYIDGFIHYKETHKRWGFLKTVAMLTDAMHFGNRAANDCRERMMETLDRGQIALTPPEQMGHMFLNCGSEAEVIQVDTELVEDDEE